jgi:C-terminal processing protease CtpA/Prc
MLFPLEERNVFLKLTTSIIKFPDGGTIPHDGLIPDIPVYISSARQDEIIRAWRSYLQGKSRASGPTEFDPVLKAAIETLK